MEPEIRRMCALEHFVPHRQTDHNEFLLSSAALCYVNNAGEIISCTDTRQKILITRLYFICCTVHNFNCFCLPGPARISPALTQQGKTRRRRQQKLTVRRMDRRTDRHPVLLSESKIRKIYFGIFATSNIAELCKHEGFTLSFYCLYCEDFSSGIDCAHHCTAHAQFLADRHLTAMQ